MTSGQFGVTLTLSYLKTFALLSPRPGVLLHPPPHTPISILLLQVSAGSAPSQGGLPWPPPLGSSLLLPTQPPEFLPRPREGQVHAPVSTAREAEPVLPCPLRCPRLSAQCEAHSPGSVDVSSAPTTPGVHLTVQGRDTTHAVPQVTAFVQDTGLPSPCWLDRF